MSGHHPFRELTKDWPPERQARVAEKVRQLQHEMAVAALQQALHQAQDAVATCLQLSPVAVKTVVHQTEQYVSTLRRCVEALGGTLDLVAHFPEGTVPITTFRALAATETLEPAH
jgi:hypothetical protein